MGKGTRDAGEKDEQNDGRRGGEKERRRRRRFCEIPFLLKNISN